MKNKIIMPLIMLNLLGGVVSAVMIFVSGANPIWIGSTMAILTLPFFLLVMVTALGFTRAGARVPLIQLITLAGLALTLYTLFVLKDGPSVLSEYIALALSLFGAAFVQWFVWFFSSYGRTKSESITKGKPLPELLFKRLDGTDVSSTTFVGSKTLMVFFRGNWCPFCMGQLKGIAAKAAKLESDDVKVKFISNQSIEKSKELADKMKLPAHFEILQDVDLQAAKTLGIEDIGGTPGGMSGFPSDTVMATVIATDTQGNVLFGDETDNYRVRPHPDTFIGVFA